MSAVVCLWLFLGLVFSHVSCSQNYAGLAGSSPKAFSSYGPIQSQDTYSRSVASRFGPSSPLHGPVSSYQSASISKNIHTSVSRSGLRASGATEHSVNQNNPSFQQRKSYGAKSWSSMAKPSVVSSGGIIILQEGGGSQGSHKKPNQHPVISNGSKPSKVNQIRWRSANVRSGSTSSNSFQSGALDHSARETSGDRRAGYKDQKPAPVYSIQKPNKDPQVRFGIPESSTCNFDIPKVYGRGSIRRCSRYREDSVWPDGSSDTILQFAPSQFNQNFSLSRSSVTTVFTSAVQTNDGGVGKTVSAPNSPVLQAWSGNRLLPGDTNQDIVPFQHHDVQSSRTARLFYHLQDKAASSRVYVVRENAPYPAEIIQNHYRQTLPSSSVPSAWNGRNQSSCTTHSSSGSSSQQRGGVGSMKPVSEPYRSSQRGVWNVPPGKEGTSDFNGYSRRFLSSKVSDSRQVPAASSFRHGYYPGAVSYQQRSTRDHISTVHHQLSNPSK
ncbi:uncharacterized protein LOC108415113 isoform X2 [Pygocentrus nattereri]|uniref:uncharacterized protein LOC108415113 isoform X2 n=1 Tax=Pygocentrus nattereri TaxID=42514 RepID=UPI000814ABEF|nr:uncharacterized protein LOC108415113 isoform X2 [Pygocentrus nattereri]